MKKVLVIIGLLAAVQGLLAQVSSDYGIFLGGTMHHLHSILPYPLTKPIAPAGGLYYRYNINSRYALRGGLNAGFFPKDPNSPNFNVPELDLHGLVEFNFHVLNPKRKNRLLSSFIATGLSYIYNNNVYENANARVLLDPNYKMTEYWFRNIAIPFNVGVKYNATEQLTLGAEWALRKTFQINWIEPDNKQISNWQSYIGILIGYKIIKKCKTCPFYEQDRKRRR